MPDAYMWVETAMSIAQLLMRYQHTRITLKHSDLRCCHESQRQDLCRMAAEAELVCGMCVACVQTKLMHMQHGG